MNSEAVAEEVIVASAPTIVFWLNTPSPHMAPLIKALADDFGYKVWVVTEWSMKSARIELGWQFPDHGSAEVIVGASDHERRILEAHLQSADFHLFSGIGTYPKTTASMKRLANRGVSHIAVITEPWNPNGILGFLRMVKHFLRLRSLRPKIDTYLAISDLSRRQLISLGVGAVNVHPFVYAVEVEESAVTSEFDQSVPFRIGFVASLGKRKNLELLLNALGEIDSPDWELLVAGSGPREKSLKSQSRRLGIASRSRYLGAVPNSEVRKLIASLDVLVLPSLFDGWGAVVNEALLAGVPVVASSAVGAAELITGELRGSVFQSGNVAQLRDRLVSLLGSGRRGHLLRWQLKVESSQSVGAESIADYLIDVLNRRKPLGRTPVAPWLREPA